MAFDHKEGFPHPHIFSVPEYFAFEERSEFKHEYIDGVIYDWGDPDPTADGCDQRFRPDPRFPHRHCFTPEEYLAFEAESEFKHEYIDGVIYDLPAATDSHATESLANAIMGS